jgi:predicted HTH domain antitoxin
MTIEIPEGPASSAELRLEVACQLYAKGRVGKLAAADMAGVDLFAFQAELRRRNIAIYTEAMLDGNVTAINVLFSR